MKHKLPLNYQAILQSSDLLTIFTYAPAGLGHLRVSHSLYEGLTPGITPILIGSHDKSITYIHRLLSIHPVTRALFELGGKGFGEDIFTFFYRIFLRSRTKVLLEQIETVIEERIDPPTTVLIIATHFGVAHQIGALKETLEKKKRVRVILVVQVTDDHPHHIWFVPEADLTFVPSERTRVKILEYGKLFYKKEIHCEVIAYPISLILRGSLSSAEMEDKMHQVTWGMENPINVMVPISGAAVGTRYYRKIIDELYRRSHRFSFHVVSKNVPYTKQFLSDMTDRAFVSLSVYSQDTDVVDAYQKAYLTKLFSFEITKPSEHAFKSLYACDERGSSLLLFTDPVGLQERDNLAFLQRHNLIPSAKDQELMYKLAKNNETEGRQMDDLRHTAATWRGICLPKDPSESASFILWCLKTGIFIQMMNCNLLPNPKDPRASELRSDGVISFWEKVTNFVKQSS
jgi:hypothetical protein